MVRLIIFDIGGVIVDFWEDLYYSYLSGKTGIGKRRVKEVMEPLIIRSESGELKQSDLERMAARRLGIPRSHLEWNMAYRRLSKTNLEVVTIIKRLKKNYKVVMLSNIGRSRLTMTRKYLVNKRWDGRIFASCDIGLRKPDVKIYDYVLRKTDVPAGEALFIDNLRENVLGARRAGLKAIVFKTPEKLMEDLRGMGILGG